MKTKHAQARAQQRGISSEITDLLTTFGDTRPAPGGCRIRFFSKSSRERLRAKLGDDFVASHHEKLRAYLVQCRDSGAVITVGLLHENKKLPRSKPKVAYH